VTEPCDHWHRVHLHYPGLAPTDGGITKVIAPDLGLEPSERMLLKESESAHCQAVTTRGIDPQVGAR
jgi:hypothetical protein